MTEFVLWNWGLCLLTSGLIVFVVWRRRFLLVKPSIIVALFFHVTIQWAATVQSPEVEQYLPHPWVFALLAHSFPLIGLAVSTVTARRQAFIVWKRITHPRPVSPMAQRRAAWLLAGLLTLFMLYYLSAVPLARTGLYTILSNPTESALAREESLKLIENPLVRYGFPFAASAVAPLLAVLLAHALVASWQRRRLVAVVLLIATIGGILLAVSLTGARSFAAIIVLVIILSFALRRGVPLRPLYLGLALVAVLALPTAFSLLREGRDVTVLDFQNYLSGSVFRRVFVTPMQTGLWHVHYAQTVGFFGLGAIPKLGALFGLPPVSAPNVIGLAYTTSRIESISANTSYVFSYYSYFGLIALPISLAALWLLDGALWIYRKVGDNLLLACVTAVSISCIKFASSDYTTTLVTHGFLMILFTALIVDRLSRVRLSVGARPLPEVARVTQPEPTMAATKTPFTHPF